MNCVDSSSEQTPPGTPAMKRAASATIDLADGNKVVTVNIIEPPLNKNKKKGSREALYM